MAYLSLSFLGHFQAWTANGSLRPLRTIKERALLAYLTVENDRSHRRETLAELFWPDRPEGIARNNLRQAMYGIRQAVGEPGFDSIFMVTADEVQAHCGEQLWLDLDAFDVHLKASQQHNHALTGPCPFCMQHLRDAVEIYRGDFLVDVFLDKNQEFQEWLLARRAHYASFHLEALEFLVQEYERVDDFTQAIFYASRQIQFDDLKESQHRRLMVLLARSGRFSAALEQYEICRKKFADSLGIEMSPETTAIVDEIRDGRLGPVSPPRSVNHNLPEQLTPFIGREKELAQVTRALEGSACRLVSLVGPGGVGKTRLAIQSVQLSHRRFPDGIYFVPLEFITSTAQLVEAVGRAVGLVPAGENEMRPLLFEYLQTRHVLLVLDNFEHLLESTDFLLELLRNLPFVKILLTSRERLRLQAEVLFELQGLSFPSADAVIQNGSDGFAMAKRWDALQLLLERASRVRPGAPWEDLQQMQPDQPLSSLDDIREFHSALRICQLVEGSPLGIELAASWARDFTFTQIADEVQRSLEFLQNTLHDLPERHRSLRASFEHSWELLTESEREVFCKLAVFPASFTASAAQTVASAALPWLVRLEDKSLVRRVAFGRYDLHPLIRQYAGQKLRQYSRKVEDFTRQQHAEYFCSFLKERELDLKGQRQAGALEEIESEFDNIRAAWQWACEHQAVDLLEKAAFGLLLFLEVRSHWLEGEEYFRDALACLQTHGSGPANPRLTASLMAAQGWFCCRLSQFQRASGLLLGSLVLHGEHSVDSGRMFAHFAYGFLCVWMSRFQDAWLHLSTSLSISERIQDAWGEAWARQVLAEIAFESGQSGFDEEPFIATLSLFDRLGEQRGSGRALNYLGNIAMAQNRHSAARVYFEKFMPISERIGDVWGVASGYGKLGQLAAAEGDCEQAYRLYQCSVNLLQKTGDQRRMAFTMRALGEVAGLMDNLAEAQTCFSHALEIALRTRSTPLVQDVLVGIAALLAQRSQKQRALNLLHTVLTEPVGDQLTAHRVRSLEKTLQPSTPVHLTGSVDEQPPQGIWEAAGELLRLGIAL